ncbi:MAG: DUF6454 family protein [Nocardioidaceae bacterium]
MRRAASVFAGAIGAGVLGVAALASAHPVSHPSPGGDDSRLVREFKAVDRTTVWSLADKLDLDFQTFHTEGLVVTPRHLFLSAVEIIEPTKKYPTPVGGYDRTPGKGIGHLFVMDRRGSLQKDIRLGEGNRYHPGGIDFDGRSVWVPVAEYRPDSSATIYRVDVTTLAITKEFKVHDHIGGLVLDKTTHHLVGNTWGSRRFYEWTRTGHQLRSWTNTSHFVDYQDCQYVPTAKMLCGGVANLPQTPSAGGAGAVYELGGVALIDLRSHKVLHEVPLQLWSAAGHVVTRNPLKLAAHGHRLQLWAAPDNGDEGNGTELLHYQATAAP